MDGSRVSRRIGLVAGVAVAALWGSAFTGIQVALHGFGPLALVVVRLVVAAAVLLAVVLVRRVRLLPLAGLPRVVACALVGMVGYQALLNTSEVHVPAGVASMVLAAAPIVGALAVRRNRSDCADRRWWWTSGVCVLGVVVVCVDAAGAAPVSAVMVVVLAAVVYGLYGPLVKPLLAEHSGLAVTTSVTTVAAVLSLPLLLLEPIRFSGVDGASWSAAAFLGVLPSAVAFLLWAVSLRRLRSVETGALLFLVPVAGVATSAVVTGTVPGVVALVGGGLVLGGLCVGLLSRWKPTPAATSALAR